MSFDMETVKTIVTTLVASGAMWGFVQFLIERKDKKNDKFKEVLNKIDELSKKVDKIAADEAEWEAITCRVRILQFMDELLGNQKHTKDSYDQVNSDITSYEKYCGEHPEFKNNQTATTIEYINKDYLKRLEKHDFL